jgi:hypothetical protein
MRDKRIWLAGLLLLGAAMSVRADDADGKASQGNWFTRMFRKAPSKEAEPPKKAKPDPKASNANESGTPVLYSPGAQRALAQTVLMRREEACLKFREIASQTGDDDLMRKADLLSQRAWETYLRQVGTVPGTRGNLTPEEMVLESKLNAGGSNRTPASDSRTGAQAGRRRDAGDN